MSGWNMPAEPPKKRKQKAPKRAKGGSSGEMAWGQQPAQQAPPPQQQLPPQQPPSQQPVQQAPASASSANQPMTWGQPAVREAPGQRVSSHDPDAGPIRAVPSGDRTAAEAPRPSGGWTAAQDGWADHGTADAGVAPVVRTGPSGLLLGEGTHGPVSIRLFRKSPTRLLLAVPDYVSWLLAYRCISLGAHLSILAQDPRRWRGLQEAVQTGGGTADMLSQGQVPPAAGRPYRPSVVVDDADFYDGIQQPLGPWQALLMTSDITSSSAVFALRSCEMALVAPFNDKVGENLRRAYALNSHQIKQCQNLQDHEVVLAMPRRVMKIAIPPTKMEYKLLFA
ncbi:hypothetical protein ACQBAR_01485 [Propionibacteriaceae bacterium Y1685]|uniref:hypothetical protein n=1 Tax=Microlunatus sp. Y1700 TaxID=3418487 RepID=UPI003B8073CC